MDQRAMLEPNIRTVLVCCGTGCLANGSMDVFRALQKRLEAEGGEFQVRTYTKATGCNGWCEKGPLVKIVPDDITYCNVKASDVPAIVDKTLKKGEVVKKLLYRDPKTKKYFKSHREISFYTKQLKVALRNIGEIDPANIQDYIARDGYQALAKVLKSMSPEQVIDEVQRSGLRGRGGAGFPTGLKWKACASQAAEPRYVVCNGDEGDPGAFMDRSIMEGDPHSVIEGMIIGAYAVGAAAGFIYVRDEYDLAVVNLGRAIEDARRSGYLGDNILGSGFSFDIEIVRGGGAFVCGEETALLASIEGNVGEPRDKYVYPTEKGLWGQPTVINNVESWANVPVIINRGADEWARVGTATSKGTKVFSLVGKVYNTGLVEVPMGTTLREIIFDIGGGIPNGRQFKAVQTGGPSGGCIPASLIDLPVDFDSLTSVGSMMGSGGMIVMDDRTCMVEVARYYLNFLAGESCGKCVPCREGIRRMLEILTRICNAQGHPEDLEILSSLGETLQVASLCGLGKTAPNPVLSTLRYFRDEYVAHIVEKRCPAGVCRSMTEFYIDASLCTGCGLCKKNCPADAISGEIKEVHVIDQDRCIKCGECINNCKFQAVKVR
ncbi:MAG: NADH-quinone oxidoreductase subunit NuoF [Syntrophothermus sp.]|uniref:NADH-quinone oxidoreductase subunit NuoF n=1 Tax=Syntrophothermus sp. TaxID=2736299 RepID=UPI00257FEB1C|nr:NADH-quinone oxidoreductase subunit NuoF [Syntrophothermus sp.]NSW82888.1 NADH-quinone oxidoreductase subunit NuoF [Syntrophothermus sp.]